MCLQDDFNLSAAVPGHILLPASQNAFENASSSFVSSDVQQTQLCNDMDAVGTFNSRRTPPGLVRVQSLGFTLSQSFPSAIDPSPTRSRAPGPQPIGRSSSPYLLAVGSRVLDVDTKLLSNGVGRVSSRMGDYGDMEAALAHLSLSKSRGRQMLVPCQLQIDPDSLSDFLITTLAFNEFTKNADFLKDNMSPFTSDDDICLLRFTNNFSKKKYSC